MFFCLTVLLGHTEFGFYGVLYCQHHCIDRVIVNVTLIFGLRNFEGERGILFTSDIQSWAERPCHAPPRASRPCHTRHSPHRARPPPARRRDQMLCNKNKRTWKSHDSARNFKLTFVFMITFLNLYYISIHVIINQCHIMSDIESRSFLTKEKT